MGDHDRNKYFVKLNMFLGYILQLKPNKKYIDNHKYNIRETVQ